MEPEAPDRRLLTEEIWVVLALSLLSSAVFAIIDLLSAPIRGTYVAAVDQSSQLARQVAGFVFALAPAWLVLYLVRRDGSGLGSLGLARDRSLQDLGRGAALFALVGAGGIGVYLAAVALGVNRFVVPVPPLGHWWTIPVLLLSAVQAALVEETIVAGYLISKLKRLAWSDNAAITASALLRGSYHLYQGWGGFAGNLAMGAIFGWVFTKTRRTWPLIVAHFLLDTGAGIGFILFRHHLPGFS